LLTIGNGDKQTNAVIKQLEKDLAKAERKQLDYRRSLTELLVRQGLLLNGAGENFCHNFSLFVTLLMKPYFPV
jgi:hypothetical protein